MTTIVMNTLNAAVTEYDWAFQSITPTHAGDAAGLYLLGGDDDAGADIDATASTGITNCGTSLKKRVPVVHLGLECSGAGQLHVHTKSATHNYPVAAAAAGVTRGKPGQGIHENYLGFGYSNVAGADFKLDKIEVPLAVSEQRRVGS
jgi:hypothetical protein